jgi:FkbM family methyltransferase
VVETGSLREQAAAHRTSGPPFNPAIDIGASMLERICSAEPANVARVVETRHGIMQHLPDASHAAHSLAWYGEYLQFQLDLLSRLIRPGAHIVEAGSGIGEHAIALAKLATADGHLWLYETRPVVRQILRQNLDVNRVAGNVTLMRRGLGHSQVESHDSHDTISASAGAAPSTGSEGHVDTLDALHLERLDLVKIRSDAVAANILAGASETLWRLRPLLFIAAADSAEVMALAALATRFGYRCWRVEAPLFNPRNFNQRGADIFAGEIALALLAVPEETEVVVIPDGCTELAVLPDTAAATDKNVRPGLLGKLRKLLR